MAAKPEPLVRWYISEGIIIRIGAPNGWPSNEVAAAFGLMKGKTLTKLSNCKTTVELSALEVLLICRELAQDQ